MLTEKQISALRVLFPADALCADNSRGFELTCIKAALSSSASTRSWPLWLRLALCACAVRDAGKRSADRGGLAVQSHPGRRQPRGLGRPQSQLEFH